MSEALAKGLLTRQRRLHFIGVGGAGMSGIAELSLRLGFAVSGCDLHLGPTTERLAALGVASLPGPSSDHIADHIAEHIADHVTQRLDAVVISSAVKFSNPEVARARALKIPVIARAEMLGELLRMARHGRRRRRHAWQDHNDLAGRADPGGSRARSDRRDRRQSARARHQRAPRARRFHGGRSRRERRFLPAAAADDRGRHEYRSRASRPLRHDGSGARGLSEFHQPRTVLWAARCSVSTASTCAGCWRRCASRC